MAVLLIQGLANQVGSIEAAALHRVLGELAHRAEHELRRNLVGVYLIGSFALGAGDIHADVDFLVAVRDPLSPVEEAGLRSLHASIPDREEHWAHVLEGSYALEADLCQRANPQRAWLYVDNGHREMEWSNHDNTEVTRWVLRNRALIVVGTPPRDLTPDVPAQALRDEAVALAISGLPDIEKDPAYLSNAWGQPYEVLTQCRLLYTASTATVVGKIDAATWSLGVLPERWHDLVRRAIADRPDPWERVHWDADPLLAKETWEFVEYLSRAIVQAAQKPAVR